MCIKEVLHASRPSYSFPQYNMRTCCLLVGPMLVMEFLLTNLTGCLERYGILHILTLGLVYLHSQTPAIMHREDLKLSISRRQALSGKVPSWVISSLSRGHIGCRLFNTSLRQSWQNRWPHSVCTGWHAHCKETYRIFVPLEKWMLKLRRHSCNLALDKPCTTGRASWGNYVIASACNIALMLGYIKLYAQTRLHLAAILA